MLYRFPTSSNSFELRPLTAKRAHTHSHTFTHTQKQLPDLYKQHLFAKVHKIMFQNRPFLHGPRHHLDQPGQGPRDARGGRRLGQTKQAQGRSQPCTFHWLIPYTGFSTKTH